MERGGISRWTISRMFLPPNKSFNNACRYTGLIPAKIGIKQNNDSKLHKDSQFCRAQVKYAIELGSCFDSEVMMFSADDKNKLNVGGGPAVCRYIGFKTYLLDTAMANYSDHNWSTGLKLILSGYMRLEKKEQDLSRGRARQRAMYHRRSRSTSPNTRQSFQVSGWATKSFTYDQQQRPHYQYPRTGTLSIYLRGSLSFRATSYNHYDDLLPLVKKIQREEGKNALIVTCDNGPDWKKNSIKVFFCMGRLWRDTHLDYLCMTSYAPGDSKFNPIEHAWSPVTIWMVGLLLLNSLPENHPLKGTDNEKNAILDQAITDVKSCLSNKDFDGFPVNVYEVPSTASHIYKDEEVVENLGYDSEKKILGSKGRRQLVAEYRFLNKHAISRHYQVEFIKCQDYSCGHCSGRQIKAQRLMTFLNECDGKNFTPTPSVLYPGHFATWRDLAVNLVNKRKYVLDLDEGLPSLELVQRCNYMSCNKVFQSVEDKKRHKRLVHKLAI